MPGLAHVAGLGVAREPVAIKTEGVCVGAGLTEAFRAAFQGLSAGQRIGDVYCDLNGEAYRADEYGFAALRCKDRFRAPTDFVAPADCWGDVGAASAPLLAILAVAAARKGVAHGPFSLVWTSSEDGTRGALLLRADVHDRA